jgi:RNA polymerase sigma-70 factor (ECF subfamily)
MEESAQQHTFLEAFDTHADAIFRYCYFKTYDREAAKDLTQETFTRVWDYICRGKHVRNMKAFLFKTANNLVIDYWKKMKPVYEHQMGTNITEQIPFRGNAEDAALVGQVLEYVRQLDDQHREVLILRLVEEMSVKEIADMLGERENTVSVRINRALNKVREHFE